MAALMPLPLIMGSRGFPMGFELIKGKEGK